MSRRNTYFKDELEFLNEIRDQAAKEHWDIARFLAVRGSDPDVERLFEGFAFLTGRLRQKLDDEFPELVQGVLGMWWPHYLRPVPAMAIVQFAPILAAFSESKTVAEGVELQSKPVDGGRCRFRTTRDLILQPLTLDEAELDDSGGGGELTVQFSIWPNAAFSDQTRDRMVWFLGDSHERACDLYRYLIEHAASIDVELEKDGTVIASRELPGNALSPVGFRRGESSLPDARVSTPGHLRLQEYFAFPESFLFVELAGLAPSLEQAERERADRLTIRVRMRRRFDWDFAGVRDPVRINCVPVANVFNGAAKPILLDNRRSEYRVVAESLQSMHCELYEVDRVNGYTDRADEPREFHRFESFDHRRGMRPAPYYHLNTRARVHGDGLQTTIAFRDPTEDTFSRGTETVSIDIRCTNGNKPRQLDPGDLCVSTASSPEYATFANITRPTQYLPPPLDGDLLWRLVSNLSLNYSTLLEKDALKTAIETYDFRGRLDAPAGRRTFRILESLEIEETGALDRLIKGLPARGVASRISVSRRVFQSLGEAYMFGCILREFLSSLAPINSFHQLTFRDRDSDEVYAWPVNQGSAQIL